MTKQILVTAFALFSLFFGVGNLILPPLLGYNSGSSWYVVLLGFSVSAVLIPILAIYGHAKLQGTIMDFAKKVSPIFALLYCIIVYVICITLPGPRTAAVTYEMAIAPYFDISSWIFSACYFFLVLIFVLNRNRLLDIVGKFLTPAILLILLLILLLVIILGVSTAYTPMQSPSLQNTFTVGVLEGYQTFDAIAGIVVGGVVVISLGFKNDSALERRTVLTRAGMLAGLGLLLIYGGLIYLGALQSSTVSGMDRTSLLTFLSTQSLGTIGANILAVLVSLACFTTAVGVITGTADFIKGLFNDSAFVYELTAIVSAVIGVVMGQLDVTAIIAVAVPALMFIYPITIVLIVINALPDKATTALVFRAVVLVTIIFSAPDFWESVGFVELVRPLQEHIPFGTLRLGWVLPAMVTYVLVNGYRLLRKRNISL